MDKHPNPDLSKERGSVETAAEFVAKRCQGAGKGLRHYPELVPDDPPMAGNELPEGWANLRG